MYEVTTEVYNNSDSLVKCVVKGKDMATVKMESFKRVKKLMKSSNILDSIVTVDVGVQKNNEFVDHDEFFGTVKNGTLEILF